MDLLVDFQCFDLQLSLNVSVRWFGFGLGLGGRKFVH
jgi:hypothetical protein